jgi:hypothetical protein
MLTPGNPLEFLTAGVPGAGFGGKEGLFQFLNFDQAWEQHLGYTYLGLLTLPLTVVGLVFGRPPWRHRLFILIALAAAVITLSGYSPLFSVILILKSPLRAVRHFSDSTYRSGISWFLILSAALGFEVIIRYRQKIAVVVLIAAYVAFCVFSALLFSRVYEKPFSSPIFGFAVAMFFFYMVILVRLLFATRRGERRVIFALLLFLVLIDVSTVSFWHVRNIIQRGSATGWLLKANEDPPVSSIGFPDPGDARTLLARELLILKDTKKIYELGINPACLPPFAFYDPVSQRFSDKERIKIVRATYNTFHFSVSAPTESLLFLRDAYSPYWSATVNGKKTPVRRILLAFKGVAVPAGTSEVIFHFSPPLVPLALALSYAIIALVAFWWLISFRREKQGRNVV